MFWLFSVVFLNFVFVVAKLMGDGTRLFKVKHKTAPFCKSKERPKRGDTERKGTKLSSKCVRVCVCCSFWQNKKKDHPGNINHNLFAHGKFNERKKNLQNYLLFELIVQNSREQIEFCSFIFATRRIDSASLDFAQFCLFHPKNRTIKHFFCVRAKSIKIDWNTQKRREASSLSLSSLRLNKHKQSC